MSRRTTLSLIAALASLPASSAAAAGQERAAGGPVGRWINPQGSVQVETAPCDDKLCGWVVWASPGAIKDARKAGSAELVGLELLRDYRPAGPRLWRGTVYVPDMGRSYSSRLRQVDETHLKISGCILGGLICKSQIWKRG
jgi:uncharacterized protein (DUF2147 family)